MATIAELEKMRQGAGRRYAAAAAAYIEAWVALHALDGMSLLGGGHGFGAIPEVLAHAEFLPDAAAVTRDPVGRASQLREHRSHRLAP